MQSAKARNSSSGERQKISPQSINSSDVPHKTSPRIVRQLKIAAQDSDSAASSSNRARRTPKVRSPKVADWRSLGSPLSEKKHPSRVVELEHQISQLENDLTNVKNRLCSSEASKKQAQKDAEESNQQLLALSSKLEEYRKKALDIHIVERCKDTEEQDQTLQSELADIQEQHSVKSDALASALSEIKQLKVQLEMVAKSEAIQTEHSELVQSELHTLRENLEETLTLVEDMKNQLRDCEELEARDQALVGETLMQLETAKQTVEALKSDGFKAMEAYDAISSKLNQSNARVNILEELVSKLKADVSCVGGKDSQDEGDCKTECTSLKLEVERLQSALEAADIRYNEEQARNAEEFRNAYALVEQIKSTTSQREAGMESEVQKAKEKIEELKANLMDKETELQCICEENEGLMMRLENTLLGQREYELEMELQRSKADVEELRKNLMEKETELQNLSEENEILRMRIKENNRSKTSDDELEIARAAEKEALKKVNYMSEEVNKSNGRAARVAEQLEAAQASNAEMDAEFRRLKVQCNQWRKAAETAATMLSTGNNLKVMDRTGSLDSNYSSGTGNIGSPFAENVDEDLIKKKNTNVLRRFGVMWKKPQK
ncbi:Interactor of constitutive active ROPs 3 [Abeliophyllum distichum]|uniref:Interactor of constitutive active ROPs 3 n=1 Tax=Abeliophyllum distichum TaxID=126358 RepID=A0ABD1RE08_9LAMI